MTYITITDSLLWDEPYDPEIARRTYAAIEHVLPQANAIGKRSADSIMALMEALIESGLCMLEFGESRPASGAEHHASHYWEMIRLQAGRETTAWGASGVCASVGRRAVCADSRA